MLLRENLISPSRRRQRLRVEDDCSPAVLWDLPLLCFYEAYLLLWDFSRVFGENFKSLDITKRPFFSLCCTEGVKMACHSFVLGLSLISSS